MRSEKDGIGLLAKLELYKKREDCYCLSAFEALENAHVINRQQSPRLSI